MVGVESLLNVFSRVLLMDRTPTVRLPTPAATRGLGSSSETSDCSGQTIPIASVLPTEAASAALTQLDALDSLVQQGTSGDAPEESDESLDDYMKNFLERMTGKKAESPAPPQPVQPTPPTPPTVVSTEPRQPTRTPECPTLLRQMRALALANSRNAIDAHQNRQLSSNILETFLPAAMASVASTGLAVAGAATGSAWSQTLSAALLVVALALSWRLWTTCREHLQHAR